VDATDRAGEPRVSAWAGSLAWAIPLLAVAALLLARARLMAPDAEEATAVQIELENPSVVPIIDVREDGIPVIWLAGGENGLEASHPG
jgi:hypothetical protein